MKKNVLIIGAGGVANVVAHKCALHNDILGSIHIASRTKSKCDEIVTSIVAKNNFRQPATIQTHAVNAMDKNEVITLIKKTSSQIVINVGSAFLNMTILQACIETGAAYIDTAVHENSYSNDTPAPWYAHYEWTKKEECQQNNITAILSVGFDPGVVNAYAEYAINHYFDKDSITDIDIIDINAGNHGRYFATNFDPEINFREFLRDATYWENSKFQSVPMFQVKRSDDLPIVGIQDSYLVGHEEVHSLAIKTNVPNIRFWMGFSQHYINVFTVMKNLGLLSINPVKLDNGCEVVPLKLVKAVLPEPSSLAANYTGKTCIGNKTKGLVNGVEKEIFIYNVADHELAFQEVGSQGISYTAGVPAVAAAILVAQGIWDTGDMRHVEELDSRPFISLLNKMGLETYIQDESGNQLLDFAK